ncbi:DNA-binding protein YbaB [Streptosporangium album]|uniref:DNA-binding protein YbaB n=1 Tax=Streptosporangium album TaxID=47479 RepID=A0A7W7RT90_9ACTN|nr:YbaB/EbfC family nucleoid-associated protein [Streptosporangium album]MBB4937757.1 DNA-binding protein YbaB [Streptosporangium album]
MNPDDIRVEEFEQARDRAEKMLAWIEGAQSEIDEIVGVGEGASDRIKVTTAANGKVLDVVFEPRALRLDSRTLAEEVLSAVKQARSDAERKIQDLMRESLDGFDPVETQARFDRMLKTGWR